MADDIIIIGSGAAGLTAAVYAQRAGKSVRVFEKDTFGGQINFAPNVENFPSIKRISGSELASNLLEQALELGASVEFANVTAAFQTKDGFTVTADGKNYDGKTVIIAVGVKHKQLGLENEDALVGNGVSYCALCDGAFFKGQEVAVAGGGDAAFQEAIFLSKTCKKVYLIHRRAEFRAEKRLVDTAKSLSNIEFITNSVISALNGKNQLESVSIKNIDGGESNLKISGVFVCIGSTPQNALFEKFVELDDYGYIISGEDCKTKTGGIFVAGDCRQKGVRQLTTAVSDGTYAALAACAYIDRA